MRSTLWKDFLREKSLLWFLPGLLIVVGIGAITYRSTFELMGISDWLNHTAEVISQLHELRSVQEGAESNQRGYLITGQDRFLARYRESVALSLSKLDALASFIRDNPGQQERVGRLREAWSQRLERLEEGVRRRKSGAIGEAQELVMGTHGTAAMDRVRQILAEMDREERTLLASRGLVAQKRYFQTRALVAASSFAAFLSILGAIFLMAGEFARRREVARQLVQAREAAERALQVRSLFLANMSHEIRTPLHSIIGMSEVLSDRPEESVREKGILIIRRAGNLLMSLVNDILDLSKLEAGKLEVDRVEFSLEDLIDHTIGLIAFRASQKGLDLVSSIEGEVPRWWTGDPGRIRQVLLNLLGNSIKFTHQGSVKLTVQLVSEPGARFRVMRFEVKDTGVGIPAEKQSQLFADFNQLDASIAREYGGTGLGLTISRRLVELMGGRMGFESAYGRGSLFWFEVPLELPEQRTREKEAIVDHRSFRPLRVLVADDIEDNRLLIQLYLKSFPFQVDFAQNGRDALEKARKERFDLIFMDMHMPQMNGYDATRAIRLHERNTGSPRTTIIALTAFAMREDADKSLEAGCDRHLTKPILRESLVRIILETQGAGPAVPRVEPMAQGGGTGNVLGQGEVVRLREGLSSLIPGFLANRQRELEQVEQWIQTSNFEELDRMGHTLKGVAGSFGFETLARIGAELQEAARARDSQRAQTLAAKWSDFLARVRIEYQG